MYKKGEKKKGKKTAFTEYLYTGTVLYAFTYVIESFNCHNNPVKSL